MDVTGVALCAAGAVVSVVHVVHDVADWRAVRDLRRGGQLTQASVVDTDRYHRFDVRTPLKRPVVLFRVGDRSYRTPVLNHLGAAPPDSGLSVLVDPDHPYLAAASGRNDTRNQLLLSVLATVVCLVLGIVLLGAGSSPPGI